MYCEIAGFCLPNLKKKAIQINDFIDGFEELIEDLKIPKKLKDVGIKHEDIPKLAEDAMKQERLLVNNPRKLELKDAISIYEASL